MTTPIVAIARGKDKLLHSTIQGEQQSQKIRRQAPEQNVAPTDS